MRSNVGTKPSNADNPDINEYLGEQVMLNWLIDRMEYFDPESLASLSCTSQFFNTLCDKMLDAHKLLQLVSDVNHVCKDMTKKIQEILRLIAKNPALMFMTAKAKNQHGNVFFDKPIRLIFKSPDLYLEEQFLKAVENDSDLLEKYVVEASNHPCDVDIDELEDLYDQEIEQIDLMFLVHQADDMDTLREMNDVVDAIVLDQIAPAELNMPRCVLDEAVKQRPVSVVDEHSFEDTTPPTQYLLKVPRKGVIDALEFSEGLVFGRDFAITSKRDPQGDLVLHKCSCVDQDEVLADKTYFHALFFKCLDKQEAIIEAAKEKLAVRKLKN